MAEGVSPLWWDKIPDKTTPEYEALTQLLYDGTPEEVAENFKEQGNEAFKRGKKSYPDAVVFYTKAIEQNVQESEKASVYHSNRAAVHFLLENYGLCVTDSLKAVEINSKNMKGYWRAARAYTRLGKYNEAISICERGLIEEPTNKEIEAERTQAAAKNEERKGREEERQRRESEQKEAKEEINKLLEQNQMVMGEQLFDLSNYPNNIYVGANNHIHFSVLFVYEEYQQTDFIEDFDENDTFADHLDAVFSDGSHPDWDVERKYTKKDVEIYFEANWSKAVSKPRPNAKNEKKLIKVRQTTTLRKVLQHESYIIPQAPVFYILVANSTFRNQFVNSYK